MAPKIKFTWASATHEKELDSVRAKDVDAQKAFCGRLFQNAGLRAEELVESMHKAIDFFASSILPSYGPEQLPKAFEAYEKRFRPVPIAIVANMETLHVARTVF
ncbi:hypothetical protein ARSEF1564_009031 [Beauveria bassiana]